MLPEERYQLFSQPHLGDRLWVREAGNDVAREIIGRGLNSETRSGQVPLGLAFHETGQTGGTPNEHHQKTTGERIEGAGVPCRSGLQRSPHPMHTSWEVGPTGLSTRTAPISPDPPAESCSTAR